MAEQTIHSSAYLRSGNMTISEYEDLPLTALLQLLFEDRL